MPWHAVDALDEAVGATRALLWPIHASLWLKLAGVCAFVGGFGSAVFRSELPVGLLAASSNALLAAREGPEQAGLLVGQALTAGVVLLSYLLIRSLLEFAFYDALVSREVRIRRTLTRQWRPGIQLFLFRTVLVSVLLLTISGGAVLAAVGIADAAVATPPGTIGIDSLLTGAVLATAATYALVASFTTRFVTPIMLVEGSDLLSAWRRLVGTMTAQPRQYLAYLGIGLVVQFVADVLVLSAVVLVAFVLLVPLTAVLGPLMLLIAGGGGLLAAPGVYLFATGLGGASLGVLVASLFVLRVPFVAYVRYYALLVLAGTDPDLRLSIGDSASARKARNS